MNKRMVQWLYQELPDLVGKGILAQSDAEKLHEHYGEIRSADRRSFVIILCSVLGAILIGLGIILLFAHNWEEFSRPVRAVLSLLPLVVSQGLAMWVVLKKPESQALKEGVAAFYSLMVGASLALIGQTYNIPNDLPAFLLTWMLLIVPLVYLMEASIPAAMFVFGIAAWAGSFWHEPLTGFLFWPLLAMVVPHFIWSLKQEKYTIRATILSFVMAIGICSGAGFTLGRGWNGSWIVIYSSLAAGFYLLGAWEFRGISTNWQRPFQRIGAFGIFIIMFLLTFRFPWNEVGRDHYRDYRGASWAAVPDSLLSLLLIGGALSLLYQFVKRQDQMRVLFGALPLLALIGYALGGTDVAVPMLLFNGYLLYVSIFRLMKGIKGNDLGVVNTGMLMLAALVLARFFDSGISFVLKGLVFIIVGIGFLVTNWMILRRKGGSI